MADEINSTVEWRAVVGFPEYEVSSDGRVRRVIPFDVGRYKNREIPFELKQQISTNKYPRITLTRKGNKTHHSVHRLVLTSFIGSCPDGHEAAHEDGDRSNNNLSNLSWKRPIDNAADKERHGTMVRGTRHWSAKLTEEQATEARNAVFGYGDRVKMSVKFGVSVAAIKNIRAGKTWKPAHGRKPL